MRLTKDSIERAQPPEAGHKERFLRDDLVRGLGLRVTSSGAKSFIFEGRIKGRPRRLTIGPWPDLNVTLARERAMEIRTAIAKGEDPHAAHLAEKREATFGELADRYMAEHARVHKQPRSIANDEYNLAHYLPKGWRTRRLSDITRSDLERLHASIGQDHGHYAANHTVRLLRHMFNRALDWELLRSANPAGRLQLFREEKRERFLSPEELQRVNAALLDEPNDYWRAYFPLLVMLGCRRTELLTMRWQDVDLAARTWRIPQTKTGNSHLLPLPAPAVAILKSLPSLSPPQAWAFPDNGATGRIVDPGKAWQRICARAGIDNCRIHDLRHTLASWLVAQGFNLPLIGRALNHSNQATTARYAHLALDPVRAAVEQNAALMQRDSETPFETPQAGTTGVAK